MNRVAKLGLAGAVLLSGCTTDEARQNESQVLLIVAGVEVESGGSSGGNSAFLLSDVIRVTNPAGIFNDNATLTLTNAAKNPNLPSSATYDSVAMERYTVRFFRTDGRNTEGVDVPYSFQGPLAGVIAPNANGEVALILVRHTAKQEPPLSQLAGGGGANLISAFAEIVVYGRTLGGDVVSARVQVGVTFGDFGD